MPRRPCPPARRSLFALGLVVAATAGSACGSSDGSSSTTTLAPVRSGTVKIDAIDNTFVPEVVTVTEGSEVVWENDGRNEHDIIPVDGAPFEIGLDEFGPGATYSWTASSPGTYRYYCSIHGTATAGMIGTVQVVAR